MNKDKIIKDLKKRNDSLKMQYEYRNIRCIHLENENQRLQQENQQLKKQKDDVVEYIKYQLSNLDLEKDEDAKAKMLGSMILIMLEDNRMLGEIDVED